MPEPGIVVAPGDHNAFAAKTSRRPGIVILYEFNWLVLAYSSGNISHGNFSLSSPFLGRGSIPNVALRQVHPHKSRTVLEKSQRYNHSR